MTAPDPDRLNALGKRLDDFQTKHAASRPSRQPNGLGIAGRLATEFVSAVLVGGGLGWGIDWLFGHFGFHTRPVFMLIFFVLGTAAGFRNVMRAAKELNAGMVANAAPPPADDETRS